MGRTAVSISGDGFSGEVAITLGSYRYWNAQVAYNDLQLDTQSDIGGAYVVGVSVNGVNALCRVSCSFAISASYTPTVLSVQPNSVSISNGAQQLVIQGTHFGDDSSAVVVKVGAQNCSVDWISDTNLTCSLLNGINLGIQAIEVITSELDLILNL